MRRLPLLWITLLFLPLLACNLVIGNEEEPTPIIVIPTPIAMTTAEETEQPEESSLTKTPVITQTAVSPSPTATISETPTPQATPTICTTASGWPLYKVQQGDTLFSIAQRAGSTVDELVAANCLSDRNIIPTGFMLLVPVDINIDYPTPIPEGEELVIYPADQCFTDPFAWYPGVEVGERWQVRKDLEGLIMYKEATSNIPITLLHSREIIDIGRGPTCFTRLISGVQFAFRRWLVTSAETNISGWVDEFDPFASTPTIIPKYEVSLFKVTPKEINTGDPITIEWEVQGAYDVHIFSYHGLHRFASASVSPEPYLPPSGSITVYAPTPLTSIQFSIGFAPEESDRWATVKINCTREFFAEQGDLRSCPMGDPTIVQAAYQRFEHGFMLWRTDTGSNTIWVMMDDNTPSSRVFLDNWDGTPVTYDEQPPPGLQQPVRGFGNVWVENDWVRQYLGWATETEQGYQMEIQKTQTAYNGEVQFFTLPDGRVIKAGYYMGISVNWEFTTRK